MIMIIIISAPLVCAKHSFELPLKLSMPQIRVICSKTWFCSGVPFLNKWNHHIFFSSNQKLPVFRSSLTLAPRMLCKVKFCQFISAIHPVFFLLLPHQSIIWAQITVKDSIHMYHCNNILQQHHTSTFFNLPTSNTSEIHSPYYNWRLPFVM